MKQCPNCEEIVGDDVKECFNCHYNFIYKRVMNPNEVMDMRNANERLQQEREEKQREKERQKEAQLKKNALYEYKTVIINDLSTGEIDGPARLSGHFLNTRKRLEASYIFLPMSRINGLHQ